MYWGGGEYLLRRSPAYVVCASDIHEISGWPLPTPRELSAKESRGSLMVYIWHPSLLVEPHCHDEEVGWYAPLDHRRV